MRKIIAIVALLHSVSVAAEPVPEGIHQNGDGRADICGLKAATVEDLQQQVAQADDAQVLDVTLDYRAYALNKTLRQLTFTTPANRTHPAVACRTVVGDQGGGSTINTEIVCHNSRENCDWLYRQFEELTKRTISALEGGD